MTIYHYLLICLPLLLTLAGNVHADVYKWKDKDGNIHFSDKKPSMNTEVINEPERIQAIEPTKKTDMTKADLYDDLQVGRLSTKIDIGLRTFQWGASTRTPISELHNAAVIVEGNQGHGSGVFISDTHVLTNHHVIRDQTRIRIVNGTDRYNAKVIRVNKGRDTALLEIDTKGAHSIARIAITEPEVGDTLIAIGAPLDVSLSNTLTRGVLSSVRNRPDKDGFHRRYFQTDAALNKGNSGGPVFNESSELIAISVSGLLSSDGASMNINYLIPIRDALDSLAINFDIGDGRSLNFWQHKWDLLKRILNHEIKINIGE